MMRSESAKRLAGNRDGSAAIEFALIAPVFFACIVGLLMLSMAYYEGASMQWSLERSLRAAMVHADVTASDIEEAIEDDLQQIGAARDFEFAYHLETVDGVELAVARISYDAPLNIPFLPQAALRFTAENVAPVAVP